MLLQKILKEASYNISIKYGTWNGKVTNELKLMMLSRETITDQDTTVSLIDSGSS